MTVRNGLDDIFIEARRNNRGVVIPYLTAGFPRKEGFVDLALGILDSGADALEIGIPFSDPLLDGPSIQHAQQQALQQGVTPLECLKFAAKISARTVKPLLFMGAYNPLLAYGLERFCEEATRAGISALIVPDLPFEEQQDLRRAATGHALHLIQLVAPTSSESRLERVCSIASGFIYCISIAGVTGARASVIETARPLVERVRRHTDMPVAVGFGIANGEQARAVAAFADGIIVGSALVNVLVQAPDDEVNAAARRFVAGLRDALGTPALQA